MDVTIEYKVKFGMESIYTNTPLSIARWIQGDGISIIESCNQYQGWMENPAKISMWMGSSDGGYYSPPDGDDLPQEVINEWITKWQKNWIKN